MTVLSTKSERIADCTANLENQLKEARPKLASLQAESPRLLACFYLGEVTRAEVNEHNTRIVELDAAISEAAQAIQGLGILSVECRQAQEKESRDEARRNAQDHYEELKGKISALGDPRTYDRRLESSFRSAAAAVGKAAEASDTLRHLTKTRDNRVRVADTADRQPVNEAVNHG